MRILLGVIIGLLIAGTDLGAQIIPTLTDLTQQSLEWLLAFVKGLNV
jgi:hypothetical protein